MHYSPWYDDHHAKQKQWKEDSAKTSLTISEGQFRAESKRQCEWWQIVLNKLIKLVAECAIPVWVHWGKCHNLRKMLLKVTSMPKSAGPERDHKQ